MKKIYKTETVSSKRDIMVKSKINSEQEKTRERMDDTNSKDLREKGNHLCAHGQPSPSIQI